MPVPVKIYHKGYHILIQVHEDDVKVMFIKDDIIIGTFRKEINPLFDQNSFEAYIAWYACDKWKNVIKNNHVWIISDSESEEFIGEMKYPGYSDNQHIKILREEFLVDYIGNYGKNNFFDKVNWENVNFE